MKMMTNIMCGRKYTTPRCSNIKSPWFLQLICLPCWRCHLCQRKVQIWECECFWFPLHPFWYLRSFVFLQNTVSPLLSAAGFTHWKLDMCGKEKVKRKKPAGIPFAHKYLPACVSRMPRKNFSEHYVPGTPEKFSCYISTKRL